MQSNLIMTRTILLYIYFILLSGYHVIRCQGGSSNGNRNNEITLIGDSKITASSCYNTIQSLRSAYYRNSGEYLCVNKYTEKKRVQCVETTNNFDVAFGTFNAPSNAVGYSSACVDFETGEYYCYEPNYSGISLGLGFFWSDTKGLVCPYKLASMKNNFRNLCAPTVNFLFSFWPEYCHRDILTPVVGSPGVYNVEDPNGYYVVFFKMGLKISASIFMWTQGANTIIDQGYLKLGDDGVYVTNLTSGTVFAYEIIGFIFYGILALIATIAVAYFWTIFFMGLLSITYREYRDEVFIFFTISIIWEVISLAITAVFVAMHDTYPANDNVTGALTLFCSCFSILILLVSFANYQVFYTLNSLLCIFRLTTIIYLMTVTLNFSIVDIRLMFAIFQYISTILEPSIATTRIKKEIIDAFITIAAGSIVSVSDSTNSLAYAATIISVFEGCVIVVDRIFFCWTPLLSLFVPKITAVLGIAFHSALITQGNSAAALPLVEHIFTIVTGISILLFGVDDTNFWDKRKGEMPRFHWRGDADIFYIDSNRDAHNAVGMFR